MLARVIFSVMLAPLLLGAAGLDRDTLLLAAHNRERVAADVPPLDWDAALAADARDWARHLAATGTFEHFEEESDDPDAQGENLWMGTAGAFSPEIMVGHWIAEKDFRPGVFPHVSRTGRLDDVGHYTQVIWRDTSAVGCAIARGGGDDYLVCRYAASGNVIGERVL